jgi:hypothetical protein
VLFLRNNEYHIPSFFLQMLISFTMENVLFSIGCSFINFAF